MSSIAPEVSQLENNKDSPQATVNNNYDNEKSTSLAAAETPPKKRASTMTRRMSFSTTRPWSSYAENYSSCLSGLRRNSSDQLIKRQSSFRSLQSSPTSSSTDLSKSLDSGQLRLLKTTTPVTPESPDSPELKRRPSKISAMHARPFHQRRWSSPVAFSVAKLVSPSSSQPAASKQLKGEIGSADTLQDCNADKKEDKICETDEIILSQEQDKTPVSIAEHCEENTEGKATASELKSSSDNFNSIKETSLNSYSVPAEDCSRKKAGEKSEDMQESGKMEDGNQPASYTKDESNIEAKTSDTTLETTTQKRNIYTEIKSNTKWSKSRNFRRRHHTIHADSRRFINPMLFTIAEQSSGTFGNVAGGASDTYHRGMNGNLQSRRSKSCGDLNTLSDEIQTNGVSVQQLRLSVKSFCVPMASNKGTGITNEPASPRATSVKYIGEENSESTPKRLQQTSRPVQVNIQTFSQIQITSGVSAAEKQKPQASKMQQYISTKQHVVFTQPKAKWASITISQV